MSTPEESAASPAAGEPEKAGATAAAAAPPTETSAKTRPPQGGSSSSSSTSTSTSTSTAQGKTAQARKTARAPGLASAGDTDAIDLLTADHRRVEALFGAFETADDRRKAEIIREVCTELTVHTVLEEEIFYPACRAAEGEETEEALDEAQVEHDCAKLLIIELLASSREDPLQEARFKVLAEQIRHHVAEEEAPRTGVFAKAKAAGVDTAELGRRLQERKRRLLKEADRLRPSPLVSFHQTQGEVRPTEDYGMPRNQGPERDERGRFMSDDDDNRRGGSYSRSRGDDRGREDDDRGGRGHGGWYGDPEGHSMAARSRGESRSFRDDDRDMGRGGRSDRDQGEGRGWYGDSRGHSQAAMRGWDERRSMRDDDDRDRDDRGRFMSDDDRGSDRGRRSSSSRMERDDRGRFMSDDDRGSDRGRRSSSSDRDRDDQGRFMSDDDRGGARGRRSSSSDRERDDRGRFMSDDDRSYRGRDDDEGDGRGWYGDSRGHAEAARRGWEGRSRSDRDDDDRSGRSDRGHGGWFGDSRGHSEASRRGWENRR